MIHTGIYNQYKFSIKALCRKINRLKDTLKKHYAEFIYIFILHGMNIKESIVVL